VFRGLRTAPPDETFSAHLTAHDRRGGDSVLFLHTRAAGQLADSRADPGAVRLAVRRRDAAARLSSRYRQAVSNVALSIAGARVTRDVDLHLRDGASRWHSLRDRVSDRGDCRVRAV